MALGDLIIDLSSIGNFNAGDAGFDSDLIVSNSGNYVARTYSVGGEPQIAVYGVVEASLIFDGTLSDITGGIKSINILGDHGEEILQLGSVNGLLYEISIKDLKEGLTATTSYTLNGGTGAVITIRDNQLSINDANCRIGVMLEDGGTLDYYVQTLDPNDNYASPVNTIDYSGTDDAPSSLELLYESEFNETNTLVTVYNQTAGTIYIHGRSGVHGVIGQTSVDAADISGIETVMVVVDTHTAINESSGDLECTALVAGMDSNSSKSLSIVMYNLSTQAFVQELPQKPYVDALTIGMLDDGSIDVPIYPASQTEIVSFTGIENVIINTTNVGKIAHSTDSQVIVIEEIEQPFSPNQITTSLKAYEGYNYTPVSIDTGQDLSFPTEEDIYFFDEADTLINSINVGQLSPLKDTDIYKVKIATNVTTDTFESITLGTTENSVDCLLSSTADPFESLEQITIPFTNSDIVEVFFKLSTDEVQTVGDASLELLVVGNLAP